MGRHKNNGHTHLICPARAGRGYLCLDVTLRRVNSGVTGNSERAFTSIMSRVISYIGSETHNILPRQVLWPANGLFRPIRVPRERSGDEVSGKLWINAAREGDLLLRQIGQFMQNLVL